MSIERGKELYGSLLFLCNKQGANWSKKDIKTIVQGEEDILTVGIATPGPYYHQLIHVKIVIQPLKGGVAKPILLVKIFDEYTYNQMRGLIRIFEMLHGIDSKIEKCIPH